MGVYNCCVFYKNNFYDCELPESYVLNKNENLSFEYVLNQFLNSKPELKDKQLFLEFRVPVLTSTSMRKLCFSGSCVLHVRTLKETGYTQNIYNKVIDTISTIGERYTFMNTVGGHINEVLYKYTTKEWTEKETLECLEALRNSY